MNNTEKILVLFFAFFLSAQLHSQVTIGSGELPAIGALLDLKEKTITTKGLGMPRVKITSLTAVANDDLRTTIDNQSSTTPIWGKDEHIGLIVYNIEDDGAYICPGLHLWEGETWVRIPKSCPNELGTIDCSALTAIKVPQYVPVSIHRSVSYSGRKGPYIYLADDQILGATIGGLSVVVDGAQVLSAATGAINVKIVGTTTEAPGTFLIPITIEGVSCNVEIDVTTARITALNCSTISGITVVQDIPYTSNVFNLPYTGLVGTIALSNGRIFGSVNGVAVIVDGAQNLTAPNGNIQVKVTGTPTTSTPFSIPITLGGASCNVDVATKSITSFDCGALGTMEVVQGVLFSATANLPYTGLTGGNLSLVNDQILRASTNGLSVLVNGNQTISAPNGNISIKIVGTPTITGNFNIPIMLAGASCNIAITSRKIDNLNCAGITPVPARQTMTQGVAYTANLVLPFSGFSGAPLNLADGYSLGSLNGLTVQVRGAQTISTANGSINIRVTGTSSVVGDYILPISLAGASCGINISSVRFTGINCNALDALVNVSIGTTIGYLGYIGLANQVTVPNNYVLATKTGLLGIGRLEIQIDGNQVLSAGNGNIRVKFVSYGLSIGLLSNIPVSAFGATCNINNLLIVAL